MASVDTDEHSQADPLDAVDGALAALVELELDGLSASELNALVERFQKLRCRLEAAEATTIARWDARRAWQLDEAKTGAAWIAWKSRLPIDVARKRVRHARALRTLPEVHAAWADGEINRSHITSLLGARNKRTSEAFDRDLKVLLDAARECRFADFKSFRDRWMNIVDPDGAERSAEDAEDARSLHLSQTIDDMWFGRIVLDPVRGAIVSETLDMIERELFEADWAEAKARLGRKPLLDELARTNAQRYADALTEMAIRARTAPADGRRPAPLFTVLVDYEALRGPVLEMWNRAQLTPGTAARHLTEADVERIVFDGRSRVLDVGAQRRFFRGGLRRGLEVANRTCWHPTCDELPRRPQVDHIHEWSKGGETTQENGDWGCDFHNLLRSKKQHRGSSRGGDDADGSSH